MIYQRIKLLILRFIKSRRFGLFFYSARFFKNSKKIKLNKNIVDLYLPNEKGLKVVFAENF